MVMGDEYPIRVVKFPWPNLVTKLPEVEAIGVQDLDSVVAILAHIDISLAVKVQATRPIILSLSRAFSTKRRDEP